MAINYPPITINGQTYDYQGIRYTASVPGSGDLDKGYWQVTTPGTFGIATAAEIDAGTDGVKYVTPAELDGSKYVREDETTGATDLNFSGTLVLRTTATGLDLDGGLTMSGELSVNKVRTNGGSTVDAVVSAKTDTDTGLYFPGIGRMSVTVGGVATTRWSGSLLLHGTDTSAPGQNNSDTGLSLNDSGLLYVSSGNIQCAYFNRAQNGTLMSLRRNGSQVGTISITGSAVSYNTTSDYRLKRLVKPMSGSIERLMKLEPSTYVWKSNGVADEGFLAHKFGKVLPNAVHGEKDAEEMQAVDLSKAVPLVVSSLQEAITMIEILEQRLAKLEAK